MNREISRVNHTESAPLRDEVVHFLDRHARANAHWSIREEYPSIFRSFPGGESAVIRIGGNVVSHVAYVARDYYHAKFRMKIGLIGSVVTDPHYRKLGLATELIRIAINELRERDCAIAILWSEKRDFYSYLGFYPFGQEIDFTFSADEVPSVTDPSVPYHPRQAHFLWRLYLKHSAKLDRSLEEQKELCRVPRVRIFLTEREGVVTSYIAVHKGADFENTIHEWAGDLLEVQRNIASIQRNIFRDTSLMLIAPSFYDLNPLRQIARQECRGILGLGKILDRPALLTIYRNFLKGVGVEHAWDRQKNCISMGGQSIVVETDEALTALVFGKNVEDNLPHLPMFLWGFDSI